MKQQPLKNKYQQGLSVLFTKAAFKMVIVVLLRDISHLEKKISEY